MKLVLSPHISKIVGKGVMHTLLITGTIAHKPQYACRGQRTTILPSHHMGPGDGTQVIRLSYEPTKPSPQLRL